MADKTSSEFIRPDWVPAVPDGMRVLVVGASGGIGRAVCSMLAAGSACTIGAHGASAVPDSENFTGSGAATILTFQKRFESQTDCEMLVDEFCEAAGGIDALIHLVGCPQF